MEIKQVMFAIGVAGVLSTIVQAQTPQTERPIKLGGVSSTIEQSSVNRWVNETFEVLDSPEFATNLKSTESQYPKIWLSNFHGYKKASELLSVLKLKDPKFPDARYMPTALALTGGSAIADGASTGWTGYEDGGQSTAYMNIGRMHYERYLSTNTVIRSCAINTMAHEIAHTVSTDPKKFFMYMEDTGLTSHPDEPGEAIATYLIGSVAQCTYLQKVKRIPANGLKACLATFGTYDFRNTHCASFPNEVDEIRPPKHN